MCWISPMVFAGSRTTLEFSRDAIRLLRIVKYC